VAVAKQQTSNETEQSQQPQREHLSSVVKEM
jgi:hypothetical protein